MNISNTKALFNHLRDRLQPVWREEATSIAFILIEEVYNVDRNAIILSTPIDWHDKQDLIEKYLDELLQEKPIQYVLGKAHFFGYDFIVNSSTLIPRPETEELVQMVLRDLPKERMVRLIDIGTGSGCIAVAVSLSSSLVDITAIDISEDALAIAAKNAKNLQATVHFEKQDIFKYRPSIKFDMVVSNPPYVLNTEKKLMHENVLKFEPELALFVPDNDPLLYYKAIMEFCSTGLRSGGKVYMEINEKFGDETVELLRANRFREITLIKDIDNKNRFVTGIKY